MLSYFSSFCCSIWILSVQLWHFHKIINKLNIPIPKNHHLVERIIIWYKKLSFGINISSYLIGYFQNFLDEILTHDFLGIEVGSKLIFIFTLEMVGPLWKHSSLLTHYSCCWWPLWKQGTYTIKLLLGPFWKQGAYTLHMLLGTPLKAWYLHIKIAVRGLFESKRYYITVTVGVPFESKVRTHYNCCWGPLWKYVADILKLFLGTLWKQSTYTLQFFWGPFNRPVARFQDLVGQDFCFYYMFKTNFFGRIKIWGGNAPPGLRACFSMKFNSRVLTYFRGCWGPLWKQITFKLQLLLGLLWNQSTCTLQFLQGALWKQSTYLWSALQHIIWVGNQFFTKNKENLCV